ncbi:MAG TPA: putative toxin-antitoxin system toxin component, PIN family [Thermoanaerobaculia bacterium]|nr:putative toxin-antitoxin system toxin component, PIN family [Thermoanaerobaculia bacterium]
MKGPAVIDTNVVESGILTSLSESPTAHILDGMLAARFRFLLSVELLAEYREVLLRPKIRQRHRLSEADVDLLLTDIVTNGTVLDLQPPRAARRQGGDDHLWQILSAEPSACLVTGDQKLFKQPARDARVVSPRSFVESIEG